MGVSGRLESKSPLRLQTVSELKVLDFEKGVGEVWITREVEDRTGDVVVASGGRVDSYLKNPVVQWAHRYDIPPVAKTIGLHLRDGEGWVAEFQFPEWGMSDMADQLRRLWLAGFINAASIGFIPEESEPIDPDDKSWWPPMLIKKWELLEWSLVPIPANQEALRRSMKCLMTPEQRRRARRRMKAARAAQLAPGSAEPQISEPEFSLAELQESLRILKGILR